MKDEPDPVVYEQKKRTLNQLLDLEEREQIDLFFTDECAFNLQPCIPYGWQPIGEQRTIRSASGRVTNLLGLLSRKGKLKAYSSEQNINSDFVIECIDEIAQTIRRETVLVLDNAPWHRAQKVLNKQSHWQMQGLYLFFLPKYSPHLNLIKTLWRKIKYEWLRAEHYESAAILKGAIFQIIRNYDHEFCINFSKNFNL